MYAMRNVRAPVTVAPHLGTKDAEPKSGTHSAFVSFKEKAKGAKSIEERLFIVKVSWVSLSLQWADRRVKSDCPARPGTGVSGLTFCRPSPGKAGSSGTARTELSESTQLGFTILAPELGAILARYPPTLLVCSDGQGMRAGGHRAAKFCTAPSQ